MPHKAVKRLSDLWSAIPSGDTNPMRVLKHLEQKRHEIDLAA